MTTAETTLSELAREFKLSKDNRVKIQFALTNLRVKIRSAKTALKRETPIEVKNVTRGTYMGKIPSATLKRDERFVLMIFPEGWRLVTWVAKTDKGAYIVQTFPEVTCREYSGSFKNHLRTYTPPQREWYIVETLTVPPNCQSIALTSETAEVQSNLYQTYDAKQKLPRTKYKGVNRKFRK